MMAETIRTIPAELTNLLACRVAIVAGEIESDDLTLEQIDAEIAAYTRAMVKKVDGVASVLLHFEDQLTLLLGPKINGTRKGGEVDRLLAMADRIEADDKRLRGIVAEVLAEQPPMSDSGSRVMVGQLHTLRLQRNGGVAPLEIAVPAMMPDEFCWFTLRLNGLDWAHLIGGLHHEGMGEVADYYESLVTREPSNTLIREELGKPCEACEGRGGWVSPQVSDNDSGGDPITCEACGGTGRRGVPGCRIGERGVSVKVS